MGQLREGDYVFDEHGKPCQVTFATEIMYDHKCYKVTFSDHSTIIADAEHLWLSHTKAYRKNIARTPWTSKQPELLTTQQMADSLYYGSKLESNHAISLAGPVEYPPKDLEIDPYVLGAWLGDGDSNTSRITSEDPGVLNQIKDAGYHLLDRGTNNYTITTVLERQRGPSGAYVSNNELLNSLRKLDLLNNKHIPREYLQGCIDQRLALLQGLMDTDGYADSSKGICEFVSINYNLAQNVKELIESLGIKVQLIEDAAQLGGEYISQRYRIYFYSSLPVFRLYRKLVNQKFEIRKYRYITSIEEVDSVPVKCVQVDSDSHLYLAGNFIPTHNTHMGVHKCIKSSFERVGVYWWVGPTFPVASIGWRLLKRIVKQVPGTKINESERYIVLPNGAEIWVKSADNPDSLRGEGLCGVVLDEMAQIKEEAWTECLRPALTDKKGWALFIGTPKGKNWIYRLWNWAGGRPDWARFRKPTVDNPYIEPAEIEAAKELLSPDIFKQEYEADFGASQFLVFPTFDRELNSWVGDIPKFDAFWGGLDFGDASTTAHKSTGVLAGHTDKDQLILLAEFERAGPHVGEQQLYWMGECESIIKQIAQKQHVRERHITWRADATQMFGIQLVRQMGFVIQQSRRGKDVRDQRVELVQRRLQPRFDNKPRLFYLPHLRYIPAAFERYRYPDPEDDDSLRSRGPLKINDDTMDAILYLVEGVDRAQIGDPHLLFKNQLGVIAS